MKSIVCVGIVDRIATQHVSCLRCLKGNRQNKVFYDNENEPSICAENADFKLFLAYLTYGFFIVFCSELRHTKKVYINVFVS